VSGFTQHIPPPCKEEVKIVFADDDILVVDKPSGLLSVPGRYLKDCVQHRVQFDFPDVRVVHRLDLDTSGLMVFALSKPAARELSRQFRQREVKKEYVAEVWGNVESDGIIEARLAPDPVNRPRHLVDPARGKEAITRYEIAAVREDSTRLRLFPETGRSHQLRVHLAHIGHPILGCDLYAHEAAFKAAPRLMLHAACLSFLHPRSATRVEYDSAPDFWP
jgi:tRNA pseudouridine32 synthase/23S rRNA pseudouridine746 synthase